MRKRSKRCACGASFVPRTSNHRWCAECGAAHRIGRRCAAKECARCDRAAARLAAYNHARRFEGADKDRRRGAGIVCPGCGATYAGMRSGFSFIDARRDFIVNDTNRDGKRRHGRRNQVLGLARQWKLAVWKAHVDACTAANGTKTASKYRRITRDGRRVEMEA